MPRTVTALFKERAQAEQALQALLTMGIAQSRITAIGFAEAREASSISGFRALSAADDARKELGSLGLPPTALHQFEEELRRGRPLIAVCVDRDNLDEVIRVLGMFDPIDLGSQTQERADKMASDQASAEIGTPLGAGLTGGPSAGITNAEALPGMGAMTNATDELGTADLGSGNTTAAGARQETERADRPGVNELGSTSSPPAPRSGPFQDRLNRSTRVRIYGSD